MLTRRQIISALVAAPLFEPAALFARTNKFFGVPTKDIQYPKIIAAPTEHIQGIYPAQPSDESEAANILLATPSGPTAFDVASYFVSGKVPADYLEQRPYSASWNPLILDFFTATNLRASNDLVPWCAAFVRWCLYRANKKHGDSPGSQSFLNDGFPPASQPNIGDIVVFTCHRKDTGADTGLGHVGFLASIPKSGAFNVLGGNQSKAGNSSCICISSFKSDYPMTRCLSVYSNGKCSEPRVEVNLKLNRFLKIP